MKLVTMIRSSSQYVLSPSPHVLSIRLLPEVSIQHLSSPNTSLHTCPPRSASSSPSSHLSIRLLPEVPIQLLSSFNYSSHTCPDPRSPRFAPSNHARRM